MFVSLYFYDFFDYVLIEVGLLVWELLNLVQDEFDVQFQYFLLCEVWWWVCVSFVMDFEGKLIELLQVGCCGEDLLYCLFLQFGGLESFSLVDEYQVLQDVVIVYVV